MRGATAALLVGIFIVGVTVGLILSRHCCNLKIRRSLQAPTEHVQLEEVLVDSCAVQEKQPLGQSKQVEAPLAYSVNAVAVESVQDVLPRRTTSRDVGLDIYRTASALSNQLDELEARPQLERLRSRPSVKDTECFIDANQINPTIEVHMDEIDLQEQIGKGGQGAVYKGTWRGAPVAVKYAICNTQDMDAIEQSVLEVVLSKKMSHPNVVQTYAWTVLTAREVCSTANINDDANLVKAALSKTSNTTSHKGPSLDVQVESDARTPQVARQLISPFANGAAGGMARPGAGHPAAVQPAAAQMSLPNSSALRGPVENISPLFERMLLESLQSGSGEDAHVKRRLDLSLEDRDGPRGADEGNNREHPAADLSTSSSSHSSCSQLPMGIDELLFRAQPPGASEDKLVGGARSPAAHSPRLESSKVTQETLNEGSASFEPVTEQACTPATAPSRNAGICPAPPRSFLSRGSSRSALLTPLRTGRARSPDSFNRRAAPGSSLLDETDATPKLQHHSKASQHVGSMHLPPRARRRIMFGHGRQSPGLRRGHAASPKAKTPEDKQLGGPWVAADSPVDTDALLGRQKGNLCEPSHSQAIESELEKSGRAQSLESCSSFNSEEGFGSPVAGRKRRTSFTMESYNGEDAQAVMVVVMEFCDLQSLHRAITKKAFKPHGKWSKQTTYRALLRTAQEIALGMSYIHGCGIVHGDLKPQNVLLKTHRIDRRGYIAKISDFGLSCPAGGSNAGYALGTVAFTAPEKFLDQRATKHSDVYAFGVLMWELYHCKEAHENLMAGQICHAVVYEGLRPEFDGSCQPAYRDLASRCWHQAPKSRPSFMDIVVELRDIEIAFRAGCHKQKMLARVASQETV